MIEQVLNNGQGVTLELVDVAETGRLDILQRVVELRYSSARNGIDWEDEWGFVLKGACSSGNVHMVEWLLQHPLGPRACEHLRQQNELCELVMAAAEANRAEVMQYLYQQSLAENYGGAMMGAVANGQLNAVKWLVEHFPQSLYDSDRRDCCVMDEAATSGHMELLEYFQVLELTLESPQSQLAQSINDPTLATMRPKLCSTRAIDGAAGLGRLDIVQWLHGNRSEGCTTDAMDHAAGAGHLDVVRWFHENTPAGCTTKAMDFAARAGHYEIVKWLHANWSEGCSVTAIGSAIQCDRLRIASWLQAHFPKRAAEDMGHFICADNLFEVLLFLRVNSTHSFTAELIQRVKESVSGLDPKLNDNRIAEWIQEHYPRA